MPETKSVDIDRIINPLLNSGIEIPEHGTIKASQLNMEPCSKMAAVTLCRKWHSRLPNTQKGPWQFAFCMSYGSIIYAVALWNNPSARTLPSQWLELRRMACAPDAPKYTASRMLGRMIRYFKQHHPGREKCISYQDMDVHKGTIYKAANWKIGYTSKRRIRDRSTNRTGTNRKYRTDVNGVSAASAPKIRWEMDL